MSDYTPLWDTEEFKAEHQAFLQKVHDEQWARVKEERRKRAEWKINDPEYQRTQAALRQHELERMQRIANGEIIDPFIEQRLKAQIDIERVKLIVWIVLTILFKGQWILWIVLIIMYNYKVNKLKAEAHESDMKGMKKK